METNQHTFFVREPSSGRICASVMSMTKPPITIKALYICHQCQTKSDAVVSVCQTVLDACVCDTALCQLYRTDRLHIQECHVINYYYFYSLLLLLPYKTRLQKPGTVEHGKFFFWARNSWRRLCPCSSLSSISFLLRRSCCENSSNSSGGSNACAMPLQTELLIHYNYAVLGLLSLLSTRTSAE